MFLFGGLARATARCENKHAKPRNNRNILPRLTNRHWTIPQSLLFLQWFFSPLHSFPNRTSCLLCAVPHINNVLAIHICFLSIARLVSSIHNRSVKQLNEEEKWNLMGFFLCTHEISVNTTPFHCDRWIRRFANIRVHVARRHEFRAKPHDEWYHWISTRFNWMNDKRPHEQS